MALVEVEKAKNDLKRVPYKRRSKMLPDEKSVLESLTECRSIGERDFVKKHGGESCPIKYRLFFEERLYPLKAVWAASHRPSIKSKTFNTDGAKRGLAAIGFSDFRPTKLSK